MISNKKNEGIEHYSQVTPCIELLYVTFTAAIAADLKNFYPI